MFRIEHLFLTIREDRLLNEWQIFEWVFMGFHSGSDGKETACNVGDLS